MTATAKRRSAEETRALIQAQLAANPEGMTVAAIVTGTGISSTTAAAHLGHMERTGRIRRAPGGFRHGRRQPDLWYAAAAEEGSVGPGSTAESGPEAPETADRGPDGQPPATAPEAAEEDTAPAPGLSAEGPDTGPVGFETPAAPPEPLDAEEEGSPHPAAAGPDDGAPGADDSRGDEPGDAQPAGNGTAPDGGEAGEAAAEQAQQEKPENPVNPVSGLRRLRPGELKLLILDVMNGHPDRDYSPTELGRLLQGRSVGAIQNALAAMARTGEVCLTQEAPRRYRAAV